MESIIHDHSPQHWLDLVSSTTPLHEQRQLLIEATTRLSIERYRNDNVLLQIWLKFIEVERAFGQDYSVVMDVFKFLKSARVGAQSIQFYEQWALFEAYNGFYKKAKAVVESASFLSTNGLKEKIAKINSKIDQLEAKNQSVDKENIYSTNSLKGVRKQVSPGLKLRAFHDTAPITDDHHVASVANEQRFQDKVKDSVVSSLSDAGSLETSPNQCNVPKKKIHQARLMRFQINTKLGPPARLLKKEQTIQLLKKNTETDLISKSCASDYKKESLEESNISQIDAKLERSLDSRCLKEFPVNNNILPRVSSDQDQREKEHLTKIMIVKEKSGRGSSEKPRSCSVVNDYVVPLKDEDEPAKDKKIVTINSRQYQKMELIGRGGSSKVFKILEIEHGKLFALKKVKLCKQEPTVSEGYLNEIELLRKLKGNKHIIQLEDYVVSLDSILLVLEYGEIDLATILKKTKSLSMNCIKMYWEQMLNAVHTIHNLNIIHSDLKPANFLLVEGELKLIDFGIAKTIPNDTTNIHRDHQTGTINFMSPESISFVDSKDSKYLRLGRPSDVWSLGCILYQMIYGSPPFGRISPIVSKLSAIVDPKYEISYNEADIKAIESIKACLGREPKSRLTIPELLILPFLKSNMITSDTVLNVLSRGLLELGITESLERLEQVANKITKDLNS